MKHFRHATATVWLAGIVSGCVVSYGHSDDFQAVVEAGCKTDAECRRLEAQAKSRVARCEPNDYGRIRCVDAKADLVVAHGYVDEYERAAAARVEQEHEAAQRSAYARFQAEREERQSQRDEDRNVQIEEYWRKTEVNVAPCESGDSAACIALSKYAHMAVTSPHRLEAESVSERGFALIRARQASETAEREKKDAQDATRKPKSHNDASATGQGRAMCCDGTTSPSCPCGGGRGCCSHHGGVCGCN